MSWLQQLYLTYENNCNRFQQSGIMLTPIAHMYANAQLEVSISEQGDFLGVNDNLTKESQRTLIPVTEKSASRSSGPAPHALCDTLSNIAGDFAKHCGDEKQRKLALNKFQQYFNALKKWNNSSYAHSKVHCIYLYLSKGCLMEDLEKSGVIEFGIDGNFVEKKINGQPMDKVLVRFRVMQKNTKQTGTWEDVSLINAYTSYYLQEKQGQEELCYVMGEVKTISENHPKGIIAANYGAKLVSANDNQGYTFRGRFQDASQAYALSYEASQKAHSALTWLVKKQGVDIGAKDKRIFICWSPKGQDLPDILDDFDDDEMLENENESDYDLVYRKKMKKLFQGYQQDFAIQDKIIVMALDAATTGRLSITYYNELHASDFFEKTCEWATTCCWYYRGYTQEDKRFLKVKTPSFRQIVRCTYGTERNNFLEIDDRIEKEQVQRLLKCMIEKQRIPLDIVQALTNRASTPLAYSFGNRERVLSTACAMIRKYYYFNSEAKELNTKGEGTYMKLDNKNHDRSYLFGRLLAIIDKVESSTYARGEARDTNAIRMQSAYVNHPFQTLQILIDQIKPYYQKMQSQGLKEYYQNMIGEIIAMINEEDEKFLNQSLEPSYLLGFYLQRAELNKKKEEKNYE